jgi:hypothetical protein
MFSSCAIGDWLLAVQGKLEKPSKSKSKSKSSIAIEIETICNFKEFDFDFDSDFDPEYNSSEALRIRGGETWLIGLTWDSI